MPPALLMFIAILVVIFVVVIVTWPKERERTDALRRVADTAGLRFEPRARWISRGGQTDVSARGAICPSSL